jgi:hypothetical protein
MTRNLFTFAILLLYIMFNVNIANSCNQNNTTITKIMTTTQTRTKTKTRIKNSIKVQTKTKTKTRTTTTTKTETHHHHHTRWMRTKCFNVTSTLIVTLPSIAPDGVLRVVNGQETSNFETVTSTVISTVFLKPTDPTISSNDAETTVPFPTSIYSY